jgi:glyoxylase-like metal-dependent hydrolase (beta-lactamase superfamily II)
MMSAHVRIGSATVISLSDTEQPYPATTVYHEAGDALSAYAGLLTEAGEVLLNFACFVIQADGRTVLVDTGWGPGYQGRLLDELDGAGIRPEAIDAVIFTHLHGDHIGWNIVQDGDESRPRFSRARYLVPEADWHHYRSQPEMPALFREQILPLESLGVMDLVDGDHVLSPSVTTVATPGHTPGHLSVAVTSGGEHGFILGDVVISAVDAQEPGWVNRFDWDQDLAVRTRNAVVDRLERERSLVGASHLPKPGLGRFVRRDGRRTWEGIDVAP